VGDEMSGKLYASGDSYCSACRGSGACQTMPISVEVNEPIGGDWEILNSTFKWTKTAAFAAQFAVPVEKGGISVLRYRVRVRW
jgi:hypothetical protein